MFATGENVGLAEWIIDATCLVDSRPRTNQSRNVKGGSLFQVMVSFRPRPYIQNTPIKELKVKPFKQVLWLVLGRGSLYDSSLV